MNIQIEKPVVVLKVHTTGRNTDKDRIVQLSVTKYVNGQEPVSNTRLINPEMPIPEDASEYHGITDEQVVGAKTFAQVSSKLSQFIGDSDILGFGITFDVSILSEEMNRANVPFPLKDRRIVNLSEIYNKLKPRDIYAAIEEFTGKPVSVDRTFSAEEYNRASIAIVDGMMSQYNGKTFTDRSGVEHQVENTVDSLHEIFSGSKSKVDFKGNIILNKQKRPVFRAGKYKDQVVTEVFSTKEGKGYYDWIINKSEYPQDTKEVFMQLFNSTLNSQEEVTQ